MADQPNQSDYSRLGRRFGITSDYWDTLGRYHQTTPETYRALLAAMGIDPSDPGTDSPSAIPVLWPGQTMHVESPGDLELEDGTSVRVDDTIPGDLPLGYHDWVPDDGGRRLRIIKRPASCVGVGSSRIWGWAVQLYGLRSAESWGLGDLADLCRLARWSRELGAEALLVNPLGAVAPVLPQQPSPYFPSSRRYRNPLYLSVHEVPGARGGNLDWESLATEARALNSRRTIDRDRVFRLKMDALGYVWARRKDYPTFDQYCRDQGDSLKSFATFCVLAEHHGGDWRNWPHELRRPSAGAVRDFARENGDRVRFHQWLQWLLDRQLARAGRELPLVHDLPIGVDPGGADAWAWQEILAGGVTVGAPPDSFNVQGQDWNLPPFIPHRLRGCFYQPFIETVRAALRHAGGLRIDHVMGLFRLFWIPAGSGPDRGVYVRYPADELLAILAVESHRAGAWIAGEDLGTVEPGVREQLAGNQILSYRLLWFEHAAPRDYPQLAMAAVTTHDLPTIAGLWSGSDPAAQERLGLHHDGEGYRQMRQRLQTLTGLPSDAAVEDVIRRTHGLLAQAPSAVVVAGLDDALAVEERPNMPGTVDQWPNWRLALPVPLEDITSAELPRAVAASLARRQPPAED